MGKKIPLPAALEITLPEYVTFTGPDGPIGLTLSAGLWRVEIKKRGGKQLVVAQRMR